MFKFKYRVLGVSIAVAMSLLHACTPQLQSELETRAVQVGQTAIAEGSDAAKTVAAQAVATAASAAATAAAQGISELETRLAQQVQDCPLSFTVDTDLNGFVPVTGIQLDEAIRDIRSDSELIGLGNDIVRIAQEKQINPYYITAHAAWESSWGTSQLARDKNNLFGYGAFDRCPYECAYTYASKAESVDQVMANVKADYLTEGGQYYEGSTLAGMNVNYATDQNWKNGIASIMNSLASKVPCEE